MKDMVRIFIFASGVALLALTLNFVAYASQKPVQNTAKPEATESLTWTPGCLFDGYAEVQAPQK